MKLLRAFHADLQESLQESGNLTVNVEPAPLRKLRQIPIISRVMAVVNGLLSATTFSPAQ